MSTSIEQTDEEVLNNVLRGARDEFATVVMRYLPAVRATAMARVRNEHDADDVTQESFIKAYKALHTLRDLSKFGPWLLAIARNACLNWVTRQRREIPTDAVADLMPPEPGPDFEKQERAEILHRQILALDEDKREVLLLHYFAGMPIEEMAQTLGIRRNAVAKRLQRAREALGERLLKDADGVKPYQASEGRVRKIMAGIAALPLTYPLPSAAQLSWASRIGGSLNLTHAMWGGAIVVLAALLAALIPHHSESTEQAKSPSNVALDNPAPDVSSAIVETKTTTQETKQAADSSSATTTPPQNQAARTIRGFVYDLQGAPAPDVRVAAESSRQKAALAETKTAADGAFTLSYSERTEQFSFGASRYQPNYIQACLIPLDADVELHTRLATRAPRPIARIEGAAAFEGTVRDSTGRPIEGVRVIAGVDEAGSMAISDAAGAFHLDTKVRSGRLLFMHNDYAQSWLEMSGLPNPAAVTLNRGGTLRVRVMKGATPVRDRTIQVSGDELFAAQTAVSDEKGYAEFRKLPAPCTYSVKPEGLPESFSLTGKFEVRQGATSNCELHLVDRYPGLLRGRILDADGKPAAGLVVGIHESDDPANRRQTQTKDDGTYELGLNAGINRIYLDISALRRLYRGQRLADSGLEFSFDGQETTVVKDLKLTRFREDLTVKMVDAAGSTVRNAEVRFPGSMPNDSKLLVRTKDGSFSLRRDMPLTIEAFDPATNRIGRSSIPLDVDTVVVKLDTQAGCILGKTIDEAGQAIQGIPVVTYVLQPGGDPLTPEGLRSESDSRGHFVLGPIPVRVVCHIMSRGDDYAVLSIKPSATVTVGESSKDVVIVVGAANATVEGRVVDDRGAAYARTIVTFNGSGYGAGVQCDGNGVFSARVRPGECTLVAGESVLSPPVTVSAPAKGVTLVLPREHTSAAPQGTEIAKSEEMMRQTSIVFKMFAGEHKDAYPPLSQTFGNFCPNMTELYPEYLSDATYSDRLGGRQEVKTCYLGYLANDEASGMRFLDAYEQLGPKGLADVDKVRQYNESLKVGAEQQPDPVTRLHETAPTAPADESQAADDPRATIPVLWEMPGEQRPDGGWVLYMDGHTEWQAYPGRFPMTEAFIARINQIAAAKPK